MQFKSEVYQNFHVIDLESLLHIVNIDVINYYFDSGLELSINKDFKKIFIYQFLKRLCKMCLSIKNCLKHILFCNPILIKDSEIFEKIIPEQYNTFLRNLLVELTDIIPIKIYFSKVLSYIDLNQSSCFNQLLFDFNNLDNNKKSYKNFVHYIQDLGLYSFYKDFITFISFRKLFI
jgi:hypothetical protein